MSRSAFLSLGSATNKVRIFVSYDREQDEDLLDRLVAQAPRATSEFEISGRSTTRYPTDLWDERLRPSAKPADSMCSWTPEILRNQILTHRGPSAHSHGRDPATA